YIVRVLFYKNNQIGTGTINIKYIYDSFTSVLEETSRSISSSQGMRFIPLTLFYGGIYRFDTSSYNDTTIRLYDEYGNLLGESFEPFAEYSDDYSDLRACLYFCNTEARKKVIVEVSNEVEEDYMLNITYLPY
ncbi:MAG: hypothetical protein K2N65_02770, partial [Anaeroplasmataceae bacterium]|nr:hypothetical protein [Anaeroplasmataceae bacterium]